MNAKSKTQLLKAAIGLVGLSALAATVIPKSVWEALLMESSSDHSVDWQRSDNGQLAATSPQGPPGSYKPLLPMPTPSPSSASSQQPGNDSPVAAALTELAGIGDDIVGTWNVTVTQRLAVERDTIAISPTGEVSASCVACETNSLMGGWQSSDCKEDCPAESHGNLFVFPLDDTLGCGVQETFRSIHLHHVGPGEYEDHQVFPTETYCDHSGGRYHVNLTVRLKVVGSHLSGERTWEDMKLPGDNATGLNPAYTSGTFSGTRVGIP